MFSDQWGPIRRLSAIVLEPWRSDKVVYGMVLFISFCLLPPLLFLDPLPLSTVSVLFHAVFLLLAPFSAELFFGWSSDQLVPGLTMLMLDGEVDLLVLMLGLRSLPPVNTVGVLVIA